MNTEMMNHPYEEDFKLLECECDFRGEATPGGLLRVIQQIATDQCTMAGMDDSFYRENKAVFLLAKQAVRVERSPRRGEKLHLRTQGEGAKRAVYKRITQVMNEKGEVLVTADSRWVLVNTENWRILRRSPVGFPDTWAMDVPVELEQTITAPEQLEPAGEGRAEYSFCDTNAHLNNTRYADIACNTLPLELLREYRVVGIRINYHREVPMGESFSLLRGQVSGSEWYVTAVRDDKNVFETLIQLEKVDADA